MANINVNIRMDEDLKRQFDSFCTEVGMSMSTAFNVFARQTVRENKIPFEINNNIPNDETLEAIREVQRMKSDPSYGRSYTDVDVMVKELLADV